MLLLLRLFLKHPQQLSLFIHFPKVLYWNRRKPFDRVPRKAGNIGGAAHQQNLHSQGCSCSACWGLVPTPRGMWGALRPLIPNPEGCEGLRDPWCSQGCSSSACWGLVPTAPAGGTARIWICFAGDVSLSFCHKADAWRGSLLSPNLPKIAAEQRPAIAGGGFC